jgi:ABC-type antimicrobial peptide transport system permease subunit
MAMGATSGEILRLSLRDGWRILALGLGLGLGGTFLLGRLLSSLLFRIPPSDPWTLGAVCLVLAGTVLAASAVPARRAARMDPMSALRYE